jgi:uncharacterized protein YabE (DUF348 family)/3D (Asp-Asp-Asp) domain-containing protein
MGQLPTQETHEESLSGISYAWRWALDYNRIFVYALFITAIIALLFSILFYGTQFKRITLIADGVTTELITIKSEVKEIIDAYQITLRPHDIISESLDREITNGLIIRIERAFPITITADGESSEVYTVAGKVSQILQKAGIAINESDKVQPALTASIHSSAEIRVVRVNRIVEETEHSLPYETIKKEDGNLLKGKQQVVQSGKVGLLVKKIEKVYEDGILISEQIITRTVEEKSKAHIVAVGTKPPPKPVTNAVALLSAESQEVTVEGLTLGVRGILKNVSLTAYTAGVESTGKNPDHPQYGITYTGTTVMEGRTIAVDPDVIPLGWWVYIDGLGFRRAEDIGSAIKGKKIDIYFESLAYANKFGRKRGYTVYVIGPKKPVVN